MNALVKQCANEGKKIAREKGYNKEYILLLSGRENSDFQIDGTEQTKIKRTLSQYFFDVVFSSITGTSAWDPKFEVKKVFFPS
jgi:hypothetical protein